MQPRWESHADRVAEAWIGGTFGCIRGSTGDDITCAGADGFGQLGGSGTAGRRDASDDEPPRVEHLWPGWRPSLGTWHGCAIASEGRGLDTDGYVACWGRGDFGQLGGPAAGVCRVDGASVACARSPVKGPSATGSTTVLATGDLFTCMSSRRGLACWGANRDAFFGTPGSCPDRVRRAWPTLHGPVPAPRAACWRSPTAIAGVDGFRPSLQGGPRGLCFDDDGAGGTRCLGGIPSPRLGGIADVAVSPGADAAACGLHDGGVVCWGEGYSPGGALGVPVRVAFGVQRIGETAIIGPEDPSGWSAACLVRRGCTRTAPALAKCAAVSATAATRDVATLLEVTGTLSGQVVSVKGRLGVGAPTMSAVACRAADGHACCNEVGAPVVISDGTTKLTLDGLFCTGDDSAQCCNAPAFGQPAIATGRLEPARGPSAESKWRLASASVCEP